MTKDAYYFSHDSNAHKDPKVLKLRAKHGWEGYGIYWAIIETLREQEDYKWLASDKHLFSFCFANGDEVINQVIDTCLDVGLLINDGEFIYSDSLTRRMKLKDEISEKRRAAGKKGGSSKTEANAKQNVSNKSKGKESKRKENKTNYAEFVSMTETEFNSLVEKYGEVHTTEMIRVLDNYKGSNGKPYKSDYRAILNWVVERVIGKQEEKKVVQFDANTKKKIELQKRLQYLNEQMDLNVNNNAKFNELDKEFERVKEELKQFG